MIQTSQLLYHFTSRTDMFRASWSLRDYSDIQEIYKGYASTVYSAVCSRSGCKVALKIYEPSKLHIVYRNDLLREARIHTALKHANIAPMYAAFRQVSYKFLFPIAWSYVVVIIVMVLYMVLCHSMFIDERPELKY